MSTSLVTGLEGRDAGSDAAYKAAVELWTLYSVGVAMAIIRTYSRGRAVGLKNLTLDDCLVWVALVRVFPFMLCYLTRSII